MKKLLLNILVTSLTLNTVNAQLYTPGAGATDIDGNTYPTIVLGNGQEWFAENLKTTRFANGDTIENVTTASNWVLAGDNQTPAWTWYDNDNNYDFYYGKLYNWFTADDTRNACPVGWKVPSNIEWNILMFYLDPNATIGGSSSAGGLMKSVEPWLWESPNNGATNESGFTARPSGFINQLGVFNHVTTNVYWWTSTQEPGEDLAAVYKMITNSQTILYSNNTLKTAGMSIRCLKDPTVTSTSESSNEAFKVYPNPSNGIYQLEGEGVVSVYNSLGEIVLTEAINGKAQIDIASQPKGIYFLQFEENNGIQTSKLVKQ
jgi:uncharacterized protein (TIGR02145 family)